MFRQVLIVLLPQLICAFSEWNSTNVQCVLAPTKCFESSYRSFDGTCNNLQNPILGAANNRYTRLLPAVYGDGYSSLTKSVTGKELPNVRLVSAFIFQERNVPDPEFTLMNMQWGQIITHDMSLLGGTLLLGIPSEFCCTADGQLLPKNQLPMRCMPMVLPKEQLNLVPIKLECLTFVRTITDKEWICPANLTLSTAAAEQINIVTSFMDLSLVYGNSIGQNHLIREFRGGRLHVTKRNNQEWPPQVPNVTVTCDVQSSNQCCYLTGDQRTNQSPELATLQIILLREHNRIANALQQLNSHWQDELIFQEARKINIGQYQQINYYEWLPIILGKDNMLKNRLIYEFPTGAFINDYNSSVDPSIINSHTTGAFRFYHTQIQGQLELFSRNRSITGYLRLSDWYNRPQIIEKDDNYDELLRGLLTQPEQSVDNNYDPEIMQFLFRGNSTFGNDMRAIDVQRNRDHGLARYNDFREICGLPKAKVWEDYADVIPLELIDDLKSLYASHEDVDLSVGGSLETKVSGSLAGPTFLCILTKQFYRTRVADRFFFENGIKNTGFTKRQLNEIRKTSFARLICNNSNYVKFVQKMAFLNPSDTNQIVPCSEISSIDLSAWKDHTDCK